MNISFSSDTYPFCCVGVLCSELMGLEDELQNRQISFPYDIGVALRCLPDEIGRKTFRRFNKNENCLTLDLTVSYEEYQLLSKNEQREKLGILLFDYIEDSLKKRKDASKEEQSNLLFEIKKWMKENNWLDGKIKKAREMLNFGAELFDVSNETQLSLDEVEYIYIRMNGYEPEIVHDDNKFVIS